MRMVRNLCFMPLVVVLASCGGGRDIDTEGNASDAESPVDAADVTELQLETDASAVDVALAKLSAAYAELSDLVGGGSGDAVNWATEEVENIGDWEYQIIDFDDRTADSLADELNALGDQRWEAYFVEPSAEGVRIYLKRPAMNYLSRVPLSTVVRILAGAGQ